MTSTTSSTLSVSPAIVAATETRLRQHQQVIWTKTDHLFAGLLVFEWLAAMALAFWRSPRTWAGSTSSVHPHLWAAVVLGGLVVLLPVYFAFVAPGRPLTRHLIAAAQMLMSALLIDLGDGRIEMHFHVFGSLAFLAFYRDWRVLITATIIVASDHLLRGLFLPHSVYGIANPSIVRTFEHAGWVIFEDIFLITSCLQSTREMRGIAENRALLEASYQEVEEKVQERTRELKAAQEELVKSARSAGMAEIATSVLHNVGNVLNSVNISAGIVADKVNQSELSSLVKVTEMVQQHQSDIGSYLTTDPRGKLIPSFLTELSTCLVDEQKLVLEEINGLTRGIDHIKQIVAAQQSMAKKTTVIASVRPADLFESALMMQGAQMDRKICVVRDFEDTAKLPLDEHKVLQILINLISNARQAMTSISRPEHTLTLAVKTEGELLRLQITDTGIGIAAEHLARIFSHGFTTKKEGHGFGLHSAANAATEMGGRLSATSPGPGHGATFTLELPIRNFTEELTCSR